MFRKIHSNRDSKDTLFTELRKEFAGYFRKADDWFTGICAAYPKVVFTAMVLLIVISIELSFTLFRTKPKLPVLLKAGVEKAPPVEPVSSGFSQIAGKAAALQESLAIKSAIETLIAKDSLSSADSLVLEKAIQRLHQLSIQN